VVVSSTHFDNWFQRSYLPPSGWVPGACACAAPVLASLPRKAAVQRFSH